MSQTAPPSDKAGKNASKPLTPPDERFWQRYSPHAELPLSSAGSIVAHILVFGLLLLASFLGTMFFRTNPHIPVEAVQLSGGGGNPHAQGEGPNSGDQPVEAGDQSKEKQATETNPPDDAHPPQLNVNPDTSSKPQFEEKSGRQIQMSDDVNKSFQNLRRQMGKIRAPGSTSSSGSSPGKGGTGSGGGSGNGKGTGIGSATGPGTVTPTQRERRHARWDMLLSPDSRSASGYVKVLHSLGAILAIPVRDNGDGFDYMVIRDLSARPAKLLNQNLLEVCQELGATYTWLENKPINVKEVLSVLRIPLPKIPSGKLHFLAVLPAKLEEKLFRLEIDYLNKRHPGHGEDDIKRTKFRLRGSNGRYEPEVESQELIK